MLKAKLKYWVPVVVWLVVIFSASADSGSAQHSSRLVAPLLHWLFPQMTQQEIYQWVFYVRKLAHVTEYGILATLLWFALRKPTWNDPRAWAWRPALWAIVICFLYAATDEIHQLYVPNREGKFADVLIDTSGAALAMVVVRQAFRLRDRWRARRPAPAE